MIIRQRAAGFSTAVLTTLFVWVLQHPAGSLPALGPLLDPINGALANSEPVHTNLNKTLQLQELRSAVTVGFEDRMVPHIQAGNDHDLYFTLGYIHAYFRLWQMDMQTRAAAGRVSAVAGSKAIAFDRAQRRKGMVFGAERSLKAMEADPRTKAMLDAYSAGINCYIQSLGYRQYPLEYKLMGFAPEPWTNIKSALLLKYMADDLSGKTDDFALTVLRDQLSPAMFAILFPEKVPGSDPVIPAGTLFPAPSLPAPAVPERDLFTHFTTPKTTVSVTANENESGIGSNNWVVSGSKMKHGASVLCNDPHLSLNLPSLWYEVQLQSPDMNVYGVSLPGAPGIIIGFNDSISWGLTNNYRDVKDYFQIKSIDRDHYEFNGTAKAYERRIERIEVKNTEAVTDTVLYTLHGPVEYDASFKSPVGDGLPYAVCWMAHRATNEFLSIYLLNRAHSYDEFVTAIGYFQCPAQNFVFADRHNNIALWGQGQFINKWQGQGRFVMEGQDERSLWGADIPYTENTHSLNPQQGYLASANQSLTDNSYPYWYNGMFSEFRSWAINQRLQALTAIKAQRPADIKDMMDMQRSVYSILAAGALPHMLSALPEKDQAALSLERWNYNLDARSKDASLFQVWWQLFYTRYWQDGFGTPLFMRPNPEITMQLLQRDSTGQFSAMLRQTYILAKDSLSRVRPGITWYRVKNTTLTHLAKIPAFSYDELPIGGWSNTINAARHDKGPSWRMVVEMGKDAIHAWGVYPGGQSGNPGSPFYNTFIDRWVKGDYYELVFQSGGKKDSRANRYTWVLGNQ